MGFVGLGRADPGAVFVVVFAFEQQRRGRSRDRPGVAEAVQRWPSLSQTLALSHKIASRIHLSSRIITFSAAKVLPPALATPLPNPAPISRHCPLHAHANAPGGERANRSGRRSGPPNCKPMPPRRKEHERLNSNTLQKHI